MHKQKGWLLSSFQLFQNFLTKFTKTNTKCEVFAHTALYSSFSFSNKKDKVNDAIEIFTTLPFIIMYSF